MASEIFKVTVTNWNMHNQKVKKGHTHFMVSKRLFDDQKIAELRPNEFQLLLYCFSICADMVSEQFEISVGMLPKYFRTSSKLLSNHLDRLQQLQLLTYEKITPLYNRKEKNRKEKNRKEVPMGSEIVPVEPSKDLNFKIWDSYREAYASRYHSEPVRNAKVNSQISQIGKRLGLEAPEVVRFFVEHNKSFYLTKLHDLGLCLSDAEALRTQWFHNKAVTEKDVKRFADNQDFINLIEDIKENGI